MDTSFFLEPAAARPTCATVDLNTLARNARTIMAHAQTGLLAVVKADAYGHGAIPCSLALAEAGAAMLGVASAEEALELRQAGLTLPVLILGRTSPAAMPVLLRHNITCTLTGPEDATALHAAALSGNCHASAHIKLDTGMSRLGVQPEDLSAFQEYLTTLPGVQVAGMFTHFAAADDPTPETRAFTRAQLAAFLHAGTFMRTHHPDLVLHCCASSGTHTVPDGFCDMVRPGLSLYGGTAAPEQAAYAVEPVMTLSSRITALSTFAPGRAISYGCTFVCPSARRIAVVPCGYADGLPRALSNCGHALVGDGGAHSGTPAGSSRLAPIAGRVCMDMVMLDVTDIPDAAPGSKVVFFGNPARLGPQCPTIDSVAEQIGAIPYELTCGISRRVVREHAK